MENRWPLPTFLPMHLLMVDSKMRRWKAFKFASSCKQALLPLAICPKKPRSIEFFPCTAGSEAGSKCANRSDWI